MESPKAGSGSESSPCRKKKSAEEGLISDAKDHLDQFVHTSMEQHRICLKKTIRGLSDFLKLRKSRSVINRSSLTRKDMRMEPPAPDDF